MTTVPLAESQTQPDNGKDAGSSPARHLFMAEQLSREMLYHRRIPWKFGDPPREGEYLVTVEIEDAQRGMKMRSTRHEYFDGKCWATVGGYARVIAWDYRARPYTDDL